MSLTNPKKCYIKKKKSTIRKLYCRENAPSRRVPRFNKIVLRKFDYTVLILLIVNFGLYS